MRKSNYGIGGLLMAGLWLASFGTQASSFQVNPIRLMLSADHSTDVVTLTNDSDTPTEVQLVIVAWSQENGEDVYTPSRNLLATPPIFTIPVGKQQIVRVGMRTQPGVKQETAYRLFFTEVPPPPAPGFRGLQVALRIGIPVFVEPAANTAAVLKWTARSLSGKELELQAVNNGSAHAQILKLSIAATKQNMQLAQKSGGYVLPGASHTWTFKLPVSLNAGTPLEVTADTDQGTLHAQLVLQK
jgi:fimbrial chaperone protein